MDAKLRILLCFVFTFLFSYTIIGQVSINISFISKFTEGPCFAVATNDSTIFAGNGTRIDILKIAQDNTFNKKSCFICDYLVNKLTIKDNILFAVTDGGLYIIDISNIYSPVQIDFYSTKGNAKSIFVKNDLVYLVDDAAWFYILDLSDLANMKLLSEFKPADSQSFTDVCVNDSLAFLCDCRGKLIIVNIKDKRNPEFFTDYNFGNKYSPNTIAIKDNYIFVGTNDIQTLRYLGKLFVFNIDNPYSLIEVFHSFFPGDWYSSSRDIIVKDSLLLISCIADVPEAVEVYNISEPTTPKILNSVSSHGMNSILTSDSHCISLLENKLFIADGRNGLVLYSIENIDNPEKITTYSTGVTVKDIFVNNNYLYSVGGYNNLNVFDFSNPSQIIKLNKPLLPHLYYGFNTSIYATNNYAYITSTPSGELGLQIVNISNSNSCYEEGYIGGIEGNKIIEKDDYAYIASRYSGLHIISVHDRKHPEIIYYDKSNRNGIDLEIVNNLCFLATDTSGIYIYDISEPVSPKEIVKVITNSSILDIAVKDSIIFIAEGSKGLSIVNYHNSSTVVTINNELSYVRKIQADNNYLYLLDDSNGLIVYDISDPFNPIKVGHYKLGRVVALNIFVKNEMIILSQGYYGFSVYKNDLITSIAGVELQLPKEFTLQQNYPNPFNPATTIKFSIPNVETTRRVVSTTLKVYDMLGREIAILVNEEKSPGNYEVTFNGSGLASGVYFYRLQAGSFSETKKLVLMK